MTIRMNSLAPILMACFMVLMPAFSQADMPKNSNATFGELPAIYQAYFNDLDQLMVNYQKAQTAEEKVHIKAVAKTRSGELQAAIASFNQTTPLAGKAIPFKLIEPLAFAVQNVNIVEVTAGEVDFMIQVKINEAMKDDKGELMQRVSVYFHAFDSHDKVIPDTGNWATNHGWIKLAAGTLYDAKGHWNNNRVQNMGDFAYLGIMSEDDYRKIKANQ